MGSVTPLFPQAAIEWPLKERLPKEELMLVRMRVLSSIEIHWAGEAVNALFDCGILSQRDTAQGPVLVLTDPRGGAPDVAALANLAEVFLTEFGSHLSIPSIFDADRETMLVAGGRRRPLSEFRHLFDEHT